MSPLERECESVISLGSTSATASLAFAHILTASWCYAKGFDCTLHCSERLPICLFPRPTCLAPDALVDCHFLLFGSIHDPPLPLTSFSLSLSRRLHSSDSAQAHCSRYRCCQRQRRSQRSCCLGSVKVWATSSRSWSFFGRGRREVLSRRRVFVR